MAKTAHHFPTVTGDGALIQNVGRYARQTVLVAFEANGGQEFFNDWVEKNPDEFFTKIFPKIITKEVEHGATQGLEDLLTKLDGDPDELPVIEDADYTVIDDE